MSQLTLEASAPLDTACKPTAEITVLFNPQPMYKDSDVDLETGEILVPVKTSNGQSKFSYKLKPNTADYEAFAEAITAREAPLWDRELVFAHADLFYHPYFQDHQTMMELRQKAQARIQSFNVKVTRQEEKSDQTSNSQNNKLRLVAKFRSALRQMYEAFEEAYTLEQPELIEDLRDHLVKPAIVQITGLSASSRCRTCYCGRHQTAVWRLSRFDTLDPIMSEVPNEAYKKAEDNQAVTILEKTKMEADGPLLDRFKLGLSEDDKKIYATLTRLEREAFHKDLKEFVNSKSPIRMSRRWDTQKDAPPSLEVSLSHTALQWVRQLRRQNLLPMAQALLNRYRERHLSLITLFGRFKV